MTTKDKLQHLITVAIENGWKHPSMVDDGSQAEIFVYADSSMVNFGYHMNNRIYYIGGNAEPTNNIIFDTSFVKSIFGDEEAGYYVEYTDGKDGDVSWLTEIDGAWVKVKHWEYALQQAVISTDPIDVLYEAVKEQK